MNELYCMAFISRHAPTEQQRALAASEGYTIVHVGDMDAFNVDCHDVQAKSEELGLDFTAVAVVHPAAALRLSHAYIIGVFENATRPVEGGAPQFEAKALHLYNLRGCRE